MKDYQPLDISKLCNAGVAFIGKNAKPAIGKQTFHGLPFKIGGNARKCFLGFCGKNGAQKPVTMRVGKKARHILFAHTLLESKWVDNEPTGRVIAHYVFRFQHGGTRSVASIGQRGNDGVLPSSFNGAKISFSEIRVPIRERFEIAVVPAPWGQLAFRAMPDQKQGLFSRYEGRWDDAGYRQTEALQAWPQSYYIYVWENPHPDRVIESITIEPTDRKFLVAAITLGNLAENPFNRSVKREVKITLPKKADAQKKFSLQVEVDRGIATFPYALPEKSSGEFLKAPYKGFGEAQNQKSSPAFVEIAATDSATVTVKQDGKKLTSANWGELQDKGKIKTPRVQLEVVDRGKNWVHVTVLDDATGQPIPCRAHFRSPEGIPFQPHGHHNFVNNNIHTWHTDIGGDLRLGQITYAYIDGKCQGWLPRGDVLVDIARGFEYEPLRAKVRIERSQRELTLRLKRWRDMNAARWFSGDTHVHFLGTQGAHCEAAGEDLNVVNLLQSQWGHLFTNTEDKLGASLSRDGNTIVYCSQENRQHILGHLTLLGLKEPVMPWCTDGPGEAELGGTLDVTLSDWADRTHAQGGTVVIPHLPNPNGETAALIATGRADAVEMIDFSRYKHGEYYRYLNCGYKLPLVGGTDKMYSEVPVGLYRTYAYIPRDEEFNYDNWCKALREGRTFLSGGPILDFTVNGVPLSSGNTIKLPGNGGTVEIEATAESIFPIHTLEIVQEGKVVASSEVERASSLFINSKQAGRSLYRLHLKTSLKIESHSWLAARCGGPKYVAHPHYDVWQRGMFAHTSPIYLAVGGDWWMFDRDTAQYMLTLVEGGLSYIRHTAPLRDDDQTLHHHGMKDHVGYLEKPFHEAAEAIHRRMHQMGIPH
jgi:hypothetical protein